MNKLELIQSFGKGKASDNTKHNIKNAVIYTRVSTKEQADTNQSLETQKKYCFSTQSNMTLMSWDFLVELMKVLKQMNETNSTE